MEFKNNAFEQLEERGFVFQTTHLEETNDRVKKNGAISLENAFVEAMFVKDNGVSSNMVRNEVYTMIEEILLSGVEIQDALNQYEQKLK